jgi:hypothetical protein
MALQQHRWASSNQGSTRRHCRPVGPASATGRDHRPCTPAAGEADMAFQLRASEFGGPWTAAAREKRTAKAPALNFRGILIPGLKGFTRHERVSRRVARSSTSDADRTGGLAGCRRRLQSVNRTLSAVRDADAILATLNKLSEKNAHLSAKSKRRWRRPATQPTSLKIANSLRSVDGAMGKQRRHAKQASMWVTTNDLPRGAAHPFYADYQQPAQRMRGHMAI